MQKLIKKGISFVLTLSVFFTFSAYPALAAVTYLYDANGNMTSDGTKCYHYNEANQMDKVTNCANGQTIAEYVYDYNGTRLVKKEFENGVLKKTVYSPADEYETVKQASNGATANTTYYKANDETIAKKNPDGSITYYHNDHLGSSAVLSDQTGAVVEKTSYEPYGEVKSGGTKSKFGYTGQEKDNETGLNYYDARYYDPHIQRFTQPDKLLPDVYDPQQLNRYSYVRNNPLKYTDPDGNNPLLIIAAVGALFAAYNTYTQVQSHAKKTNQNFFKAAFDPKFKLDTGAVANAAGWGVAGTIAVMETVVAAPVIGGLALMQAGLSMNNAKTFSSGANLITSLTPKTPQSQIPYSSSRPAYGSGQVQQVWDNAKQPDGIVYDPKTLQPITWDKTQSRQGQWDMGHIENYEYRKLFTKYSSGEISIDEFLEKYRNPAYYRPELPSSNRSNNQRD